MPLLPSCISINTCLSCGYKNERKMCFIPINVEIAITEGTNRIQKAIDNCHFHIDSSCYECRKPSKIFRCYECHLLLDMSLVTDITYDLKRDPVPFHLSSIDKKIHIDDEVYNLVGFVDYKQYEQDSFNGHYTAYLYNSQDWYQYDDIDQKRCRADPNQIAFPHVILYVKSGGNENICRNT